MNRRDFLRRIGAVTAIASAAAVAGIDPTQAADFDPEKLLYVPGAKKIFDLHDPKNLVVDEKTLDAAIEHLTPSPFGGMPRYTLTTDHGTALFNDKWQLLNPRDLVKRGMSEREVSRFAQAMADPSATSRYMVNTGFGQFEKDPRQNIGWRKFP